MKRSQFSSQARTKRDERCAALKRVGLWEKLSDTERELAGATMETITPEQQLRASWRIEVAVALMWALRMIDTLPPFDEQGSHDLLEQFPVNSPTDFVQHADLRSDSAIDRMRGIAELLHWRSRTRQLQEQGREFPRSAAREGIRSFDDMVRQTATKAHRDGRLTEIIDQDFAAKGIAYRALDAKTWAEVRSITVERHFALNWLCGYAPGNRWDETPTDT